MPVLRTAAIAASFFLLAAADGCGGPSRSAHDGPVALQLDEPPAHGILRYATFGDSPVCDEPSLFHTAFVNGPDYAGMEDNDLRGFLDGNFKYAWNQPGQTHVRLGRRGKAPRYGEHELFRVVQRWDRIQLPPHSQVEEASLSLTVEKGPASNLRLMLYAVERDWDPGRGGTLRNNVSPPVRGEVWWNFRAHGVETWGLPGLGYAADAAAGADTPVTALAEASYEPDDPLVLFRSAALAAYVGERIRLGLPLLFLLKLSDFQEDLPGSLISLYSANQGDTRNVARRPVLELSWRSAAELQTIEKQVLLEYGRLLELPRLETGAARHLAWTFESQADGLIPTLELRGNSNKTPQEWARMPPAMRAPDGWAELRLLAVRDPVALGRSFASRLADTWVVTAAPEEQQLDWRFLSPTGVEHRIAAEYQGNYRWVARFTPDELGPWRYRWTHAFTPRGWTSPWGTFDVVLGSREDGLAQLERFLQQLQQLQPGDDPKVRERWMIRFSRLERAVMMYETPESFAAPGGFTRRDLMNEIRALLGEPVPDPIPLVPNSPPPWARQS